MKVNDILAVSEMTQMGTIGIFKSALHSLNLSTELVLAACQSPTKKYL